MNEYKLGDDAGPLEPWPFDNPKSEYVIREGSPQASGRIDAGWPGHMYRTGVWRSTEGEQDPVRDAGVGTGTR